MDFDTVLNERISADTDFQSSLADLSDDEKTAKIGERRNELTPVIFKEIADDRDKEKKIAGDQKTRAEKAERERDDLKPKPAPNGQPPKDEDALSVKDLVAFQRSNVHEDDIEDVQKAAKVLGVSIPEALKDDLVKGILEKKETHRKSAQAANPGGPARQPSKKVSGAELLKDLSEGKIPEKGTKEAEDVFWERRGGRRD